MPSNKPYPKVSIITVVYNSSDALKATIESITSQIYPNIEHIVIDGGSTDGSVEVANEYKDHIAYYLTEKDKGLYDAMNKGLRASTGEFVWFINTGDYIEDNSVLVHLYEHWGLMDDVYYGETNFIDESGKILGTRSQLTTRKIPEQLTWKSFRHGQVVSHQSIIVKRELAGEFDLQYKVSADVDWGIRVLKKANSIVNTHQILTKYLVGGFSKQHQQTSWKERFNIFVKHYGWFEAVLFHVYFVLRAICFRIKN
jgi:glycosyltransferase involved in cell wall biosynthesis